MYVTTKAIKTEINQYCYHIMDQKMKQYQKQTSYGGSYMEAGIFWKKKFKKELSILSRQQLHDLLELRTGHNRLPWFQFNKLQKHPNGHCSTCQVKGNFEHFVYHCTNKQVQTLRNIMKFEILEI